MIIECGQSLDEWARDNASKDFITIFQVLCHAGRALEQLHEFGQAHRDVKPGNILRRPKQHDWTLIDFGCAAPIGSVASLVFSIKYAAPELIQALEAGDTTIIVDAAVDVWAIGVIAFELLTGERICATQNVSAVQDALAGRSLLPWEGLGQHGAAAREAAGAAAVRSSLSAARPDKAANCRSAGAVLGPYVRQHADAGRRPEWGFEGALK
eukprot:jgi/Ulvmu1/6145/UM277_0004.1